MNKIMPSPHPHTTPPPPHYPPMPAFPGRPPLSPPFGARPGEGFPSRNTDTSVSSRGMGETPTNHGSYSHFPQKSHESTNALGSHQQSGYPNKTMDSPPMFPHNRAMDGPYGSHRFLQDHHLPSYSPYSTHHPFPHPGNYGPPHGGSFGSLPSSLNPSSSLPSSLPPSSLPNSFPPSSLPTSSLPSSHSSSGSGAPGLPSGAQNSPPLEAFVQLLLAMNTDDQLKVGFVANFRDNSIEIRVFKYNYFV